MLTQGLSRHVASQVAALHPTLFASLIRWTSCSAWHSVSIRQYRAVVVPCSPSSILLSFPLLLLSKWLERHYRTCAAST